MGFYRTIEDFTCGNCGYEVSGNGYTNHCPQCLWSRHVDIDPGDRSNECRGMMEPIGAYARGVDFRLVHQCQRCGQHARITVRDGDSQAVVTELAGRALPPHLAR